MSPLEWFLRKMLFDSLKVWENIMFKSLTKKESELITKSVSLLKMVGLSKRDANLFLLNFQEE